MDQEQIDVVFSNTFVALEAAIAARATGRRHVWHGLEMLDRDPDLIPFIPLHQFYSYLDALTDKVIVVSESVARAIRPHLSTRKLLVVHTGIEHRTELPARVSKRNLFGISESAPVVSYAGVLSKRKGVLDLVEAARDVHARIPNVHFALAGEDGGSAREVRRRIREYGLGSAIRLMGYRRDVLNIIRSSDLFVLPSLADPLPVSVLEAMSLSIPVVATNSGGCSEMVQDQVTGYLVETGNPTEMAAAILRVIQNPTRAREMGENGRLRVQNNFTIKGYVDAMEQVLVDLQSRDSVRSAPGDIISAIELAAQLDSAGPIAHIGRMGLECIEYARSTRLGSLYRAGRRALTSKI